MSVLNQSGEEQVECPLCMEPLEVDDLNFFPCTCGYQICRFCWHRIRTDENGLCPACRKAYSEDPADFIPLSQEQVAQLKAEKRQRDQQRKAKLSESRKHLASVRVVQRNLVFVVGLPMRLAEPEVLKRHEYFGKFGKIHKVVINQSTSYAGTQGPSASAYVTYIKSDDALRAIQSVNNVTIDGRQIKSSLGTTKYCSHFMKNQACPKPDCMYLHDFGDPEASFTKEEMHAGKHQEYEKKLHDSLVQRSTNNNQNPCTTLDSDQQQQLQPQSSSLNNPTATITSSTTTTTTNTKSVKNKDSQIISSSSSLSSCSSSSSSSSSLSSSLTSNGGELPPIPLNNQQQNKENWPQLNITDNKTDAIITSTSSKSNSKTEMKLDSSCSSNCKEKLKLNNNNNNHNNNKLIKTHNGIGKDKRNDDEIVGNEHEQHQQQQHQHRLGKVTLDKFTNYDDNSSFFSHNSFQKLPSQLLADDETSQSQPQISNSSIFNDSLPDINTSEDWAAAFGFPKLDDEQIEQQQNGTSSGIINQDIYHRHHNHLNEYNNRTVFDVKEPLIDAINYKNGYKIDSNYFGKDNGLDQHMSKFFMDFHIKNGQKIDQFHLQQQLHHQQQQHQQQQHQQQQAQNGFFTPDQLLLLQQHKKIEELMNLSFMKNYNQPQQQPPPPPYLNGELNGFSGYQQQQQQQQPKLYNSGTKQSAEDELDFDPFQETQKALAEMMANEQNSYKTNQTGVGHQMPPNGLNKPHLPPPPPGFVQPNPSTHMNSFGSKILPFLNMSNQQQQQQQQQPNQQTNWGGFAQMQHISPQLQKNLSSCNDWKEFDSAIVTTSRHYPLTMGPTVHNRFQGVPPSPQPPQLNGRGLHDYQSIGGNNSTNAFSNFSQQIPPTFANYPTGGGGGGGGQMSQQTQQQQTQQQQQQQQSFNWLSSSDLSTQISSPPGFRNTNQATKQQEC